ncbi:MAG TPA: DsbA family protein, partial [Emticicia sp.]
VWLEDPLDSSYPPSIAFKAAQLQDEKKAIVFLRNMREMVFLQKKNITKWEVLKQAAIKAGLDSEKLKQDYEGIGKELFQADLSLAKKMGVRGFPSIFVTNSAGDSEFIYGTKPYSAYETGINKIYPKTVKITYAKNWESLFHKYPTLTLREFSELAEVSFKEAEETLEKLVAENKLKKFNTKNGAIWIKE